MCIVNNHIPHRNTTSSKKRYKNIFSHFSALFYYKNNFNNVFNNNSIIVVISHNNINIIIACYIKSNTWLGNRLKFVSFLGGGGWQKNTTSSLSEREKPCSQFAIFTTLSHVEWFWSHTFAPQRRSLALKPSWKAFKIVDVSVFCFCFLWLDSDANRHVSSDKISSRFSFFPCCLVICWSCISIFSSFIFFLALLCFPTKKFGKVVNSIKSD